MNADELKRKAVELLEKVDIFREIKIEETLDKPPQPEFGDLASNACFILSKKLKKPPQVIAEDVVSKLKVPKGSLIAKAEAKAGYINLFFDQQKMAELTLKAILKQKDKYGSSTIGKGKKMMVEFAHPNTHKSFHIGHLRNICIGESVSRILESQGYKIIRTNYEGDIGPHIAKCLWGFLKIYRGRAPKKNRGEWLGRVYAEASKRIASDKKAEEEMQEINRKLYAGDKKIVKLWKKTRGWSLDDFAKIYKELGVKFNRLYFESEVEGLAKDISRKLLENGMAKESEGAIIIDLTEYNLGIFVLLTAAGLPLYESKDLGLAFREFSDFKIDRCIHVVGSEQKFYFQQLFKVFELIDSPAAGKSHHLVYELVSLKSGKMSSRLGMVVLYTELRDKILEKVRKEIEKRNPKLSKAKKEKLAKSIGLGALKYGMLRISPEKRLIFNWQQALELEGDTGPYLQYAYVRANKILKKAKNWKTEYRSELTAEEDKLIKKLAEFPSVVSTASEHLKSHLVATYAHEIADIFNEFYHTCPVLKSKERNFRLTLVKATKTVLGNCLQLLGMETPEMM